MAGKIRQGGPDFRATGGPKRSGWAARLLQAVIILPFLALLMMAVWFQLTGGLRLAVLALVGAATLAILRIWWAGRGRSVWGAAFGLFAVAAIWWSTIRPVSDADWLPDVAHGVTADVTGRAVTLHNVRNFDWQTPTQFTPRWETRGYQLDQLNEVDLFTSTWGNPDIAHVMIGFGFADGQHVVFSVETRMQVGQTYSTFAGFFRKFNLVVIAADERDIIRLRTDIRNDPPESVSIYRLPMRSDRREKLFLDYLKMGNDMAAQPEFYNTATTNCTTVPWRLAREAGMMIPMNWRILVSGRLPEYLQILGFLEPGVPFADVQAKARLSALGAAGPDGVEFSRRLRAGH